MTEENDAVSADDFLSEIGEELNGPAAIVAPHELGGLKLIIRSREPEGIVQRETRIEIPEAAMLIAHIQALITMAFNTIYAQQAQLARQAQSGQVILPGR